MSDSKNFIITRKIIYAAVFLASAIVFPFLTGGETDLEIAFLPMHIPVLLCGFICGGPLGFLVGAAAPLITSTVLHSAELIPTAVCMSFELAVYGCISGYLYKALPKKFYMVILNLIITLIVGRVAYAIMFYCITMFTSEGAFTVKDYISNTVAAGLPGIILQIIVIPLSVCVFKKFEMMLNE